MGWFGGNSSSGNNSNANNVVPGYVRAEAVPAAPVTATIVSPPPASAPVPIRVPALPRNPTMIPQCPNCGAVNVMTRIRTAPHFLTWLACLAIFGFFFYIMPLRLGCLLCWLPLVIDTMKQTDHYCQNCQHRVGHVPPLQGCFVKQRG